MYLARRQCALAAIVAGSALALALAGQARAAEVHEHVEGAANAPVTMIEYASLTCPHCAEFDRDILPELRKRYIEPGKVKLIYRDFPLDQVAVKAAVIAHCAGDERYFTFIDAMFRNQSRWIGASDPVASLEQLAQVGGLSRERVAACLADQAMENAVMQSRLDAQSQFNVSSTPTFIINGKVYPGTRSIDDFAAIIDPLLAGTPADSAPATKSEAATPIGLPSAEPPGLVERVRNWMQSVLSGLGLA